MLLRYREQLSALLEQSRDAEQHSHYRRCPSPPRLFPAHFPSPEPSKRRRVGSPGVIMSLKREDPQIFIAVVKTEGAQQFCAVPKKEEGGCDALAAVPKEEDIEPTLRPMKVEISMKRDPELRFFAKYTQVLAHVMAGASFKADFALRVPRSVTKRRLPN